MRALATHLILSCFSHAFLLRFLLKSCLSSKSNEVLLFNPSAHANNRTTCDCSQRNKLVLKISTNQENSVNELLGKRIIANTDWVPPTIHYDYVMYSYFDKRPSYSGCNLYYANLRKLK